MEKDKALAALLASLEENQSPPRDSSSHRSEKTPRDKSQKGCSQDSQKDPAKRPKPEEEEEDCERPDFSAKRWKVGEICIVYADGKLAIHKGDWPDIEYKVIEAFANMTDELNKQMKKRNKKEGTRALYYEQHLVARIDEDLVVDLPSMMQRAVLQPLSQNVKAPLPAAVDAGAHRLPLQSGTVGTVSLYDSCQLVGRRDQGNTHRGGGRHPFSPRTGARST
jgi:hypothetical protein